MPTPAEAIDAAHARLVELGYSVGYFSSTSMSGRIWWSVDLVRVDRRITIHAATLVEAYRSAIEKG